MRVRRPLGSKPKGHNPSINDKHSMHGSTDGKQNAKEREFENHSMFGISSSTTLTIIIVFLLIMSLIRTKGNESKSSEGNSQQKTEQSPAGSTSKEEWEAEHERTLAEEERQKTEEEEAKKKDLQNPFTFSNIDWRLESDRDTDGKRYWMLPKIFIYADVTNKSDQTRDADLLPRLVYTRNNVDEYEEFSTHIYVGDSHPNSISPGETVRVGLSMLLGADTDASLAFEESESKPVYEGLEGLGEKMTVALREKAAGLDEEEKAAEEAEAAAEKEAFDKKLEDEVERARSQREQRELKEEAYLDSTCYVTSSGGSYHMDPNCHHIRSSELKTMKVRDAQSEGYEPCDDCDRRS